MSPTSNQVGSFLPTKQVVFNNDEMTPSYISEAQRSPKLIDMSLLKKGMHNFDPKKHLVEPEKPVLAPMFTQTQSDSQMQMPQFTS